MTSTPHGWPWTPRPRSGAVGAAPTHPYCRRVGISSWEGLWCRFEGDGDERAGARWAPEYRREAWRLALADQGVDDDALAEELGERFGIERRARHEVFADARRRCAAAGVAARARHQRGVVPAAREARRLRLGRPVRRRRGLRRPRRGQARRLGVPARALALGARADAAVMVGDNLDRDVEGARAAGLAACGSTAPAFRSRTALPRSPRSPSCPPDPDLSAARVPRGPRLLRGPGRRAAGVGAGRRRGRGGGFRRWDAPLTEAGAAGRRARARPRRLGRASRTSPRCARAAGRSRAPTGRSRRTTSTACASSSTAPRSS